MTVASCQISSDLGNCPPRQGIACKFQMANLLLQELAGKGAGHRLGTLGSEMGFKKAEDKRRQSDCSQCQHVYCQCIHFIQGLIGSAR
jgi:hypothetical protein